MSIFKNLLSKSEEYIKIRTAAKEGISPIHICGVADAQKAHLIYTLKEDTKKKIFAITFNETEAARLEGDLIALKENCVRISEKELELRKTDASGRDTTFKKLSMIDKIESNNIVICTVAALLQMITPKNSFNNAKISFRVGDKFSLESLSETLTEIGYSRCDTVESRGCYSIRGGIVDIFSPDSENPIRMEFFDDEIDSLRTYDVMTQKSTEKIDFCTIIPAKDIDETGSLLTYIESDSLVILDEPLRISETAKAFKEDVEERVKTLLENGNISEVKDKYINDYYEILNNILNMQVIGLAALSQNTPDYRPKELFSLTVKTLKAYSGNFKLLVEEITYYRDIKYKIVLMAGSLERVKRLTQSLIEEGFSVSNDENSLKPGVITLLEGSLSGGFIYPEIKTAVISDKETLSVKKVKRRKKASDEVLSYAELSVGDYVVHEEHGIGKFSGTERISANGILKDYIKILYRGDDVLYVPVGQMDVLHKYKSGIEENDEEKKVRLNKLGGAEWKNTKNNVRKNAAELAEKLIKLYSERSTTSGHAFPCDTEWQKEFESEFIYEETDDQNIAIEEMKKDMESNRSMDRLLLGDVGFGKTEVAMRGAFKCVTDSMQVAYLVPTTVLAAQQYTAFLQRMKNYPITVEMLSRFKSKKEQEKIIKRTKNGEIDILIGTHRMLSKDVEFKNLGLLIIDEEQRFGVAHKEAIKELKKNVDVLSMSATPIPRSLNMAMVGIRDMSVLTMPPEDRVPVQTYAMEYSESVVFEAIERELSRGGQVYYLHNRVSGIYKTAEKILESFPRHKVAVAHGQMAENALEKIMMEMADGEIDILVCTTIIETGLDIPNVNTIIIEDADKMGLSQLYQLRGRVGRSSRLAYAYLTYRRNKVLTEVAEKRLKAIKDFTEFGSGFKIAMRDLELRGAGNVLGPEQSGFIAGVGYEVYCRILSEAVLEAKGEKAEEKKECFVDLNLDAYIPDKYIENPTVRLQIYKKIAGIDGLTESYDVTEEIEDRFGTIPDAVMRLIDVALIRAEAKKLGIEEISQKNEKMFLYIDKETKHIPEMMASLNGTFKGKVMFLSSPRNTIQIKCGKLNQNGTTEFVKKVLQNLKRF